MAWIQYLASLLTLFITQTGCDQVHKSGQGDVQLIERREGESVVLPCVVDQSAPPPFGVYLKRTWMQPTDVLFMYTNSKFTTEQKDDLNRISVSGDPSSHALNVTISELRVGDTDRYFCQFVVGTVLSEDLPLLGKGEFFLIVSADAPGPVDIGLVETCAGGSAVLPCLPPNGESLIVEGVSLKRQKGRAPVEVLYHSKRHGASSPPSSSSHFPVARVQLFSAPGPGGITYNLTLQQLQPEDSGLYSCQLLLGGRADSTTSLGRQVFFLSVQGDQCGCSSYSILLYALSSAVAVLLILLLISVVVYKSKSRRRVKSLPQVPIYEEMTGVKAAKRKLDPYHLEDLETSSSLKSPCPENHYERPSGALWPRSDSHK